MSLGIKSWLFYSMNCGKRIPSKEAWEILPYKELQLNLYASASVFGGLTPAESVFLLSAAAFLKCRNVFEIGTCTGITTYNLACNIPGKVFTLDLPQSKNTVLRTEAADQAYMDDAGKPFWSGRPHAGRIEALKGDSAAFDYTGYHKRMDLVFVDGSHSQEYVTNDSAAAFRLLAPGGMILWHDYMPAWPGVVRALNKISKNYSLYHLKGTSMVIYKCPVQGEA